MFATFSECMEFASKSYRMSSTCGALQQNLSQGCWAVIKRNPTLLSALSSRNRPKRPQLYLQHHYWWRILGVWAPLWDEAMQSSQWKTLTSPRPKKAQQVRSNVKSMSINFSTLMASCIRNLSHQDRRWMKNHIAAFWGDWGWSSDANVQTSGTTTPGFCIMTTLRLTRRSSCGSFWLLRMRQSSPTPLLTGPGPLWFFSYSRRWIWSSGGDVLTALKRSSPYRRM